MQLNLRDIIHPPDFEQTQHTCGDLLIDHRQASDQVERSLPKSRARLWGNLIMSRGSGCYREKGPSFPSASIYQNRTDVLTVIKLADMQFPVPARRITASAIG